MVTKRLPRYMVPHHIVVLDEMPLTSHGKVDEAALAALPEAVDLPAAQPETPTEAALAELLAEILQSDNIDVTADFVRQGLDSIVALSVVQAARQRGIALRARLMLECGTIRELAAAIDGESVSLGTGRRRRRPDHAAVQRALALRVRRPAAAGADRSHPAARRHHPRAVGDAAADRHRRPRGAAKPAGPRHHDVGRTRRRRCPHRGRGDRRGDRSRRRAGAPGRGPPRPAERCAAGRGLAARRRRTGAHGACAGHGPGIVAHRPR